MSLPTATALFTPPGRGSPTARPAARPGLLARLLAALLALVALLPGAAQAAGTPAGTVITNAATLSATPEDPALPPLNFSTLSVQTTVLPVCALSVLPNGTAAVPGQVVSLLPGERGELGYTLTNTGNAEQTFALSTAPDTSSTFTPAQVEIVAGRNGAETGPLTRLTLAADAVQAVRVRFLTDSASRGSAFLNLVAACAAAAGGASDSDNVGQIRLGDPPALTLTKTFGSRTAGPGSVVPVTLSASNTGQGASREVLISDSLSGDMAGFSYVPGSASAASGSIEYADAAGAWTTAEPASVRGLRLRLARLAPDQRAALTFSLRAPATPGSYLNTATLQSGGVTLEASDRLTLGYQPLIAIGPVSNPLALPGGEGSQDDTQTQDVAFVGQQVCFQHTLQNLGDRSDDLRVAVRVLKGQADHELRELDGAPLRQPITLEPGARSSFGVCYLPTSAVSPLSLPDGSEALSFRLTASSSRGAPDNLTSDLIRSLVTGRPALSKSVSPGGTVRQGDLLTYRVTVSNPLSVALTGVVLRDDLNPHLTLVSVTGGGVLTPAAAGVPARLTWTVGSLTPGQAVNYTVQARVLASAPDDAVISNSFVFSSREFPGGLGSNEVRSVVYGGSLNFSKTSSPAEVAIGDTVTYTFVVTNPSANATVRSVQITDDLPVGIEYVAGSSALAGTPIPDPAITGRRSVWTLGELGPRESLSVTFRARVTPQVDRGSVTNTAIASAISGGGATIGSGSSSATNRVRPLIFGPIADIVGTVFVDHDRDGVYTQGQDRPVQNARVLLANGRTALTDAQGRYRFGSVQEGFWALRLDPASVPYAPLTVPSDGGLDGSRGVSVRNLTSVDFPLAPQAADIDIIRETTLRASDLLTVRKRVTRRADDQQIYQVTLTLTSSADLPAFVLSDTLPDGAVLLSGEAGLSADPLTSGVRTMSYTFRYTGETRNAVTDPAVTWRTQ